jgi:hypothetical protein
MTTSKIINQKHAWQWRKKWMTCFLFKDFFSHFYEFSPWWHASIQLSSTNLRWTWFTCNSKRNRTNMTVWLGHDHLTFTPFMHTTSTCELLQAIQIFLWEQKWKQHD